MNKGHSFPWYPNISFKYKLYLHILYVCIYIYVCVCIYTHIYINDIDKLERGEKGRKCPNL